MTKDVQLFDFEGNDVRITDQDGQPWFVAHDVCRILGYANTYNAIHKNLKEFHIGRVSIRNSAGALRETTIINESGLYRLILRSLKPEAEAFQEWVTSRVLPAIREHGKYELEGDTASEKALTLAHELIEQHEKVQML